MGRGTLAFAVVAFAITTAVADLDLVLLHTNDMHSHFDETDVYCNECREDDAATGQCYGGFARTANVVREERQKAAEKGLPSLFMVAGDTFQGTPYYSFYKWEPVVDFVKQLQPDIMTLGNHEFDDGIEILVPYLKGINDTIPTVVSNLNLTAEPDLNKFILPSYVFTLNNTKVGVVGYLTTDTPTIADTGAVEFFDEVKSLKREIKKLRDDGVNIIIGLGHSGIEVDKIIAKEVEDIDLIVGGHSHTFLYSGPHPPSVEIPYGSYPFYVTNSKNKTIPILQVYANTKYIGKVDLRFDSNGDLVSINGSPLLLNHDIKQDPAMIKVLDKWKPMVIKLTSSTIGRTAVELINNCHVSECNIGNLIADSLVYYNLIRNHTYTDHWTDAPIGIIQCGGIRTSINETNHDGYITLGQLINVIPFSSYIVKITISGSALLEALEHSVSDYIPLQWGRYMLQVSGIMVEFNLTKKPGQRVSSLLIRCGNCSIPKFEPLVLNSSYTIVMNDYLAGGGDNYHAFKKILKKNEILNIEDYNATAIYMQSISPIMTGIERRISFITSNDEIPNASIINTLNSLLSFLSFTLWFYNYLNLI